MGRILFCVGFYTLQIFISRWWLSRYQYGPLEYIWRLGTYGKMMPLKRKARSHNSNESVLKYKIKVQIAYDLNLYQFYASLTALCIGTGSSFTFTLRCGTILNTIFKSTADALPSTIPLSVKIRMLSGVVRIM